MASIPSPNRINVPAWTALMRRFRGEPDAAEQFAEGLASEMNQFVTYDNLAAQFRAMELRLVRWMVALWTLGVGTIVAIDKLT